MKKLSFLLAVSAAAFVAGPTNAAVVEFTDRGLFTSAVGPLDVETFTPSSHFPITSGILNSDTREAGLMAGDILSGVTYSTQLHSGNGFFFNIDSGGGFDGGFLDSLVDNDPARSLMIRFDQLQAAFGFDTNAFAGAFTVVLFDDNGQQISNHAYAAPSGFNPVFFGFQNDATTIRGVEIAGGTLGIQFAVDNFTFNAQPGIGAVPEPASWALMIAGFGLVGSAMRRRKPSVSVSFA